MARQVTVYNKNAPIFDISVSNEKGISLEDIGSIRCQELMPVCIQKNYSRESVEKWLNSRMIPLDREGYLEFEKVFNSVNRLPHSLFSLSDQYWLRWSEEETWKDGNYFTNVYEKDVGLAMFSPWAVKNTFEKETPDLTTNGKLTKRWVQPYKEKGDLTSYMIKSGSRAYHQDPIAEVLASIQLRSLDIIPFVNYDLKVEGLRMCSICKNFIDENSEFVPALHIYQTEPRGRKETVYEHMIRMSEKHGVKDAKGYLDRMIVADRLICNNDRHLGNFGFIRRVTDGKLTGFAPLFDSGSAFFGNSNKNGSTSRLFSEQMESAFESVASGRNLSKRVLVEEVRDLIETYPSITELERQKIYAEITRTAAQEIKRLQMIEERTESEKGIER